MNRIIKEKKTKTLFNLGFKTKKNKNCKNTLSDIFLLYNNLNLDISHMSSRDDICTPMECVKTMVDYIPECFWQKENIRVLDPCCGNGNFGAYLMFKTKLSNIYFNDINKIRLNNCMNILSPNNISTSDFLNYDVKNKFDLIISNPPYSGGGNKNKSISNMFIEKAIDLLEDKGYLCFITPNNWMSYNNKNTTLKKLLNSGSFLVIDNNAKKYFKNVGSSFVIFLWQKNVFNNKTKIINNFLKKDIQEDVIIPNDLNFIPLYISNTVLEIIKKVIVNKETGFRYRCDLHRHCKRSLLSDVKDDNFIYETIHTPNKMCYAKVKQDIYSNWNIIIPLSTYFKPYIKHNVNVTQSVGYYSFKTQKAALNFLDVLKQKYIKLVVHVTRYGNFNNIMVLKHLNYNIANFTKSQLYEIELLESLIKY